MLEKFELMSVNYDARSGGIIGIFFYFFKMTVCCVFSLELPHRGDSNERRQNTIFIIKENDPRLSQDSRTNSKQPWEMSHQCPSHRSSTLSSFLEV